MDLIPGQPGQPVQISFYKSIKIKNYNFMYTKLLISIVLIFMLKIDKFTTLAIDSYYWIK